MSKSPKRLYLIPVLSKALDILELLQAEGQPLSLEAIHRRTHVSKTTVYRVLKTFVHRGYISQAPDGTYRHVMRPKKKRRRLNDRSRRPICIGLVWVLAFGNSYLGLAILPAHASNSVRRTANLVLALAQMFRVLRLSIWQQSRRYWADALALNC